VTGLAGVLQMELEMGLEVSYNENYCLEGLVERRRGATECEDGVGEAHRV
jgi:hypothetical protein